MVLTDPSPAAPPLAPSHPPEILAHRPPTVRQPTILSSPSSGVLGYPTKGLPPSRHFIHSFVQELFTERLLCADTVLGMKESAASPSDILGSQPSVGGAQRAFHDVL